MDLSAWLLVMLATVFLSETEELSPRKRRVVDGNDAFQSQFPYIASLQRKFDGQWICSAVIIDIRWILTAGHCLNSRNKNRYEVVVGSFRKHSGKKYRISQMYIHPNYKSIPAHTYNDVGLIRLAEPLTLSETVQIIPLGLPPKDEEETIAVGWGRVDPNVGSFALYSPFLQSIVLKVMETGKCQEIHDPANNIVNGTTQICVYSDVKGSPCSGDSGGPLVRVATGRLVGIFSGFEDCAGKYPTLFVNLSTFVGWIESVTERKFPLK